MKFEVSEELKIEITKISKKFNISLFILFGSRARGGFNKDSDYDFAFYSSRKLDEVSHIKIFNKLQEILRTEKIDLLNIKEAKNLYLVKKVFEEGKIIFERELGLFKEMKWRAWCDYQDFERYENKAYEISKREIIKLAQENG